MNHLSKTEIVELRDGAPVVADARAHVDECERCQRALVESETRAVDIASALTDLDERFDVESARDSVRARLAIRTTAARPRRDAIIPSPFWTLGKAATFLLLATGALSALPGSPLREFISGRESGAPAPSALAPAVSVEPVGMRMLVEDGSVVVELEQVPSGTSIEIQWLSGPAVTVRAAPGSSFASAEGLLRATITGGPVMIELPESASEVSLSVNGRMYMQRSPGGESVSGPVDERDANRIRFIVP
jgi:hypothetical protein